jgi:hypothetical protein
MMTVIAVVMTAMMIEVIEAEIAAVAAVAAALVGDECIVAKSAASASRRLI